MGMLKEDENKNDIVFGHEQIVKLLLNIFGKEEKEKLFEYLLKENKNKNTALHNASKNGHVEIVKLLLNPFSQESENEKLIEYLKKENKSKKNIIPSCFRKWI